MNGPEPGRGAAVVLDAEGRRILVIKRFREGRHYAVLPGGHVEEGETFEQATVRELREETTLEARISRLLWTGMHGDRPAEFFLMMDVTGTPVLSGEDEGRSTPDNHYELVWAVPADFERLNLIPADVHATLAELLEAPETSQSPRPSSQAASRAAWTQRTVVAHDGTRLQCRDSGDSGGPGSAGSTPLVMLHGLAGHSGEWGEIADQLSRTHRIITVDQRGHGASDRRPGSDRSPNVARADYVEDVRTVIHELGLDRPVLIGQSLGGHTAMLAAAAIGQGIRGLALIEAAPGDPEPGTSEKIGSWLDSWPKPFPTREAAVQFFGGGRLGEGWADGLEERDGGWWSRVDRDVMAASLEDDAPRDDWAEWERISCPVLVVLAQRSIIPVGDVERMFEGGRKDVVGVSVPGTGHDVHLEQPGVVAALIAGFLAAGKPPAVPPASETAP